MDLSTVLLVLSIFTTAAALAALLVRMGRQLGVLDSRFDAVDQRFDTVDQRFDGIDQRLDRMDARFDGVDRRLERVEDRLTSVQVDVARIGQTLDDHVLDPRAHRVAPG